MSARARHAFEEHTGEVRVRIEAETLPLLFEEAARALCEVLVGPELPRPSGTGARREVRVEAPDRDALLVDWLNELVFLSETEKQVYPVAHVESVDDRSVRAHVEGVEPEVIRTAVKAATMHGVRIERRGDRFSASIVLDV